MKTCLLHRWAKTALLVLGGFALFTSRGAAQVPTFQPSSTESLWDLARGPSAFDAPLPPTPISRVPRLRLFRIAPGFLSDPLGMQEDDCDLPGVPKMPVPNVASIPETNDGPDWLQIGMGNDNPFFDLRRPGDPGGIGYYRVNTQVSLLDSPTTACTFGIQAVTPGGIQFGGVPDGPTVLSPAFSVFHAVTDRLAVQGFVSKNVPLYNGDGPWYLQRNLQCGLALQRPLITEGPEGLRNLFFTVGALGKLSPEHDSFKLLPSYDVLPGLQWHVNENWWVSSAVLVPVGPVRSAPGQWQLTCSLRF